MGLAQIAGIVIDPATVQTNIVLFQTPDLAAQQVANQLQQRGVGLFAVGSHSLRAVTNLMVSTAQIDQALEIIRDAISEIQPKTERDLDMASSY